MDETIKQIMSNIFGISIKEISAKTSDENVKSWDSLNHITFILALEETFQIKISEDEMIEMTSYPKIKEIITKKIEK